MSSGSRSAWLRRIRRSGWARVVAQLAVPVVLGILIGGVLAYQAGSSNNAVIPTPLGAVPSPTPAYVNPSAAVQATLPTAAATITQTPTASASGR